VRKEQIFVILNEFGKSIVGKIMFDINLVRRIINSSNIKLLMVVLQWKVLNVITGNVINWLM
jgi:hypothetical protein